MSLKYEMVNNYGVIYLDRPEKRNAISKEMIGMFHDYLDQAKKDMVRFLVITSKGEKMFCSGGDLTYLHPDLSTETAFTRLNAMKEVLYKVATFPVPVIGLLNGNALGGGCELATACDIRIAKENTKFGFVQSNLGILPGWGGGVLLYEQVQPNFAFQWLLEAKVYDACYLKRRGWLAGVVHEDEFNQMDVLLKNYISKSYEQMIILKKKYNKSRTSSNLFFEMTKEVEETARIWGSAAHKKAVGKFLSRK